MAMAPWTSQTCSQSWALLARPTPKPTPMATEPWSLPTSCSCWHGGGRVDSTSLGGGTSQNTAEPLLVPINRIGRFHAMAKPLDPMLRGSLREFMSLIPCFSLSDVGNFRQYNGRFMYRLTRLATWSSIHPRRQARLPATHDPRSLLQIEF